MKLDSAGETVASNKLKGLQSLPRGLRRRVRRWRLVIGGTLALALTALLFVGAYGPATRAAEGDAVEYTFGPPVQGGEHTYDWYRKTHADEAAKRYGVDPKKVADGMDTWHWWCGADNPEFWRKMTVLGTKKEYGAFDVRLDFFRMLATTARADRWTTMGLINDPDTVPADKPDQYGLMFDRTKDGALTWDPEVFGYPSGVIGFQLFTNKKFDAKKWSMQKYLRDPGSVEPPYNVGMACALCHVSFNPANPPKDPANPKWENLTSNIGNLYFREGMMVGTDIPRSSFAYQYLYHQQPGTSETSRYPSDFINGPIVINSIYRLGERLKLARPEKITPAQRDLIKSMYAHAGVKLDDPGGALGGTEAEPTMKVPHVLADGADSMGLLMASTRVYVNEGCMHDLWVSTTWALNPFDLKESIRRNFKTGDFDLIGTARKDPNSPWMQTEVRMPNMALFLGTYDSFPLASAKEIERDGKPGKDGKAYLTADAAVLTRGKIAFADNCASCHSSKRPDPMPKDPAAQKKAWYDLVQRDDFLIDNYLSDDQRYNVNELGTNAQRAMGSNANAGHTWGQMSSQTYKDQRVPTELLQDQDANGKPIPLYNPLTGKHDIKFNSNRSFYRTPTLVSIWATAPYLHNNSVGIYNADPSVAGRMEAYEDGMTKLLWPEKRLGVKSIKVTTDDSTLPDLFPMLKQVLPEFADLPDLTLDLLHLPNGTPINLLMNVHPKDIKAILQAYVDGILQGQPNSKFAELRTKNREIGIQKMMQKLVEVNMCPDFIEDRGHTYGRKLSDEDKRALIAYMKNF
jgi:mono/diheme cytochrome c family protein